MTDANPLSRYLIPLRRWWPVVAGTMALGLVVAWVTLPEPPPDPSAGAVEVDPEINYRATHVLLRALTTPETSNFNLVVMLARQGEVEAAVESVLGDAVAPGSVAAVELEPNADLGTLSITAVQPTPDQAALLATTWAEQLTAYFDRRAEEQQQQRLAGARDQLVRIDERLQVLQAQLDGLPEGSLDRRLLDSEIEVLVGQYGSLQAEVQGLANQEIDLVSTFETLQEPVPISTAADAGALQLPTDGRMRFVIAAFVALLLGIALVFAIDYLDTRIRGRRDLEEAFGLPVLAELPRRSRRELKQTPLPAATEPSSAEAEVFRSLRLALALAPRWQLSGQSPNADGSVGYASQVQNPGQPRTIVVSSPRDGEGKSTVCANLAASFAETGHRVLVVDCDFRRSKVADLLGARPGRGLRDISEFSPGQLDRLAVETRFENVSLVHSGSPGLTPPWVLANGSRLGSAETTADVVIFDTGPLLVTNEAAALIPSVDTLLLVARYGRSSREEATRATEQLARLGATIAGIVLVGSERSRRYGYYYQPLRRSAESGEPIWP